MNNFIWQINDCPDLDIDKQLHEIDPSRPHLPLDLRQTIERRILWGLCKHLWAERFYAYGIYDGDERHAVANAKEVLEEAFNLDEIRVFFKSMDTTHHVGSVYFIWGNGNNGLDCIADWSWVETEEGKAFDDAVGEFSDKVQV